MAGLSSNVERPLSNHPTVWFWPKAPVQRLTGAGYVLPRSCVHSKWG